MAAARPFDDQRAGWSNDSPRVTVGYDGSPSAARAVAWAADHARLHKGGVTIVSAWPTATPAWPPTTGDLRRRARLRASIGARLARVRAGPTVPVRTSTHPGSAVGALVAESGRSDVLVLGTHRCDGRHLAIADRLGAVTRQVVIDALCPVVLVGPAVAERRARRGLLVRPWPSDDDDAALQWAAAVARTERLRLQIVTCWELPFALVGEDPATLTADVVRRAASDHQRVMRLARSWTGGGVRGALSQGSTADVLEEQLSDGDMVVVPRGDLVEIETVVEQVRGVVVVVPPPGRPTGRVPRRAAADELGHADRAAPVGERNVVLAAARHQE